MAFVVDLSRPKSVVAVFSTHLFCFCCFRLLPAFTWFACVVFSPCTNRRRWIQGEFAIILLFHRHLSAIVISCDEKKWNEKKCVNRNRFEICVKLLNTKVTEKSRSIFILYIVIIRKSVRLVLQEKKNARVAKKERKTPNTESLVTEESPKLIILLKIVHYLSQE